MFYVVPDREFQSKISINSFCSHLIAFLMQSDGKNAFKSWIMLREISVICIISECEDVSFEKESVICYLLSAANRGRKLAFCPIHIPRAKYSLTRDFMHLRLI